MLVDQQVMKKTQNQQTAIKTASWFLATQRSEAQYLLYKVCPSVCLSVTFVSHAYMVQDIEINFTPYDRVMFLVF